MALEPLSAHILRLTRLEAARYNRSRRCRREVVMRTIQITAGDVTVIAELDDSITADAIWQALPIEARANTWGDEIYFGIDVHLDAEDPREVVDLGDVGYWPPGHAFCLFFGRTPMSLGNEIRPASPVNVFGRIQGDATVLREVASGATVRIEPADESAS
jgi:hypothetical protein